MTATRKLSITFIVITLLLGSINVTAAQNDPSANQPIFLPLVGISRQSQLEGDSQVVVRSFSEEEQNSALAFWTRERNAQALPLEMVVTTDPSVVVDVSGRLIEETPGPAGFSSPGSAAPDALARARSAFPEEWAAIDAELEATSAEAILGPDATTGTSQVYTAYFANRLSSLQSVFPHYTMGRVSMTTPSGTAYCSGTSISGNIMVTAAHCLYDSTLNRWHDRVVFMPAYRYGSAPFGYFTATTCWVLSSWVNLSGSYNLNTWARHDIGVCRMGLNASGSTLNYAVGWAGRAWNYGYTQHLHSFGYPFRDINNQAIAGAGQYLHACAAESFAQTTDTLGMGCNMGGGRSGGAWLMGYAPGVVSGWVNSVNSGIFLGTQNNYGPRFTSNNIQVLCNAAGC